MKKFLVLMLALALLLCGCGGNEPVEDDHIVLPEPIITTEPQGTAQVEIPQVEIPQVEIPQVEVTEPQPIVVRVQDQYSQVYSHPYIDSQYCVHIPEFFWDGSTELIINENILNDHRQAIGQNADGEGVPMSSAAYSMGQANGFASVITCFSNVDYDYVSYSIFHLNATTGLEATDDDILAAFGYTRETFYTQVKLVMEEEFHEVHANIKANLKTQADTSYYNNTLADHLADENIQKARPYIDAEGQLCFVAEFYTFAGAGYVNKRLCLTNENHDPTPLKITCSEHV